MVLGVGERHQDNVNAQGNCDAAYKQVSFHVFGLKTVTTNVRLNKRVVRFLQLFKDLLNLIDLQSNVFEIGRNGQSLPVML